MRNQIKWGSILSYVQMAANVAINLLFTPIMLRLLGSSEYGLYNTVVSTISMLSILSLGFNSGYIRYYAKYKAENDEESISKLNGLFLTIFFVIGFVALLCGAFLSFNLDIVFDNGLTEREYEIARVLMLLLTFNLAFQFPTSVFRSIISAQEKYIFLKVAAILKSFCGPMASIILLLMGFRSIAMVLALVVFHLVDDIVHIYYAFKKLKIKVSFGRLERGLFRSLFLYTIFIAINMLVDQVNWNVGKIILGRYKGTTAVSIYAVAYTISTSYNLFSTAISGVFTPRIHKFISTAKDALQIKERVTSLFVRVGRIQFLILALVSSGIVFYGKQFITEFWAGKDYSQSYYVLLLLILPATIPLVQNIGIEVQRAQNKHQFRSVVYLFMAAINLSISIMLSQRYGAVGAATGTATSMLIANGIVMNIYYHKKCNIDILLFWKNIIGMLKGLILPITFGIASLYVFNTHTLLGFAASVLCYTAVYTASMWVFVMNESEKLLVTVPLKKVLRKIGCVKV